MGKVFEKRVSKKKKVFIDLEDKLGESIFRPSDDKLLKGAQLQEMALKKITVKEQVRTKFNDASIKELAQNIKLNGLIQPLVIHQKGKNYHLICGERRYRAMTSIKMDIAPCFILRDRTDEELMAIQFSENTAREELHYIDKANGILNYKISTGQSERKIQQTLGISKSEVHRGLIIGKLDDKIKNAAKIYKIEKYVLVEYEGIKEKSTRHYLSKKLIKGEIRKRTELRKIIKELNLETKGPTREEDKKPVLRKKKTKEATAKASKVFKERPKRKTKLGQRLREMMTS